jgi:antitoxin component of MazEF toxin-antitoxin module
MVDSSFNVHIIVTIMNRYVATVIKTGNAVALRVPKQYAAEAELVVGEKVMLPLPGKRHPQDRARIQQIVARLQEIKPYRDIANPITWQRDLRRDRRIEGRS